MSDSILHINSEAAEQLVGSLRSFLTDNNIILARNTVISIHEIRDIQDDNSMTHRLVLETEVVSIGPTANYDRDSGIYCFSPSSSIAPFESTKDPSSMHGEGFGDAETWLDFVSQPSPEFLFGHEDMDYVDFINDPNASWPATPLPLPESEAFTSNSFPELMDEDWTFNDAEATHILTSPTDVEAMGGNTCKFLDLGNLHEDVDITSSTLATTCQWSPGSPAIHVPKDSPSYQSTTYDQSICSNSRKRGLQAHSTSNCQPPPTKRQTLPGSTIYPENQSSPKKTEMAVMSAAKSILRTDYLAYLEAELPRWAKGGLWDHAAGNDNQLLTADPDYYDLQIAYSDVCQLHTWMEDDVIRSRMALIRLHLEYLRACEGWQKRRVKGRIGRGDATCIIDHILQKAHHDWPTLSKAQCSTLRARFHERKRYGKRWAVLADELGKSILFLCSQKVAAIVCNTTVTFKMLGTLIDQVSSQGEIMSFLNYMKPVADSLYRGESLSIREVESILDRVRCYKLNTAK